MGTTEYTGGHKTGACRALALSIAGQQNGGRHGNPLPVPGSCCLAAARNLDDIDLNGRRAAWPHHEARGAYPPLSPHTHAA